jgi:inner membrane protein
VRYKSHIIFGLTPVAYFYKYDLIPHSILNSLSLSFFYLFGIVLGSLLPDVDEPNSYIGKKLPFISKPLRKAGLKHRTFTHSVFFPLLFLPLGYFFNPFFYFVSFGILMHLIGDYLTNTGIPVFYPFSKKRVGAKLFNTGETGEFVFISLTVLLSVVYLIFF